MKLSAIGLTVDDLLEAAQDDEYKGYCVACGAEHYGIEPDARRYKCEECGQHKVYGAEEMLLMVF